MLEPVLLFGIKNKHQHQVNVYQVPHYGIVAEGYKTDGSSRIAIKKALSDGVIECISGAINLNKFPRISEEVLIAEINQWAQGKDKEPDPVEEHEEDLW